jgi:hypothetical protein
VVISLGVPVGNAERGTRVEGNDAEAERARPSEAQRRYLERGLVEPGGKLPLFDREGREIPHRTVETCVSHGWAEPWFDNPLKPGWLVCKLTPAGYRVLGHVPPANPDGRRRDRMPAQDAGR